jgi:hypothetical protein
LEDTINSERYQVLLEEFINELDDEELQRGIFQQDGAPAHTSHATLNYLDQYFYNRIISVDRWPPRSPLSPLDNFLFGHFKNSVFRNHIDDLDTLKIAITKFCQSISPECLKNVFQNMKRRVRLCLAGPQWRTFRAVFVKNYFFILGVI